MHTVKAFVRDTRGLESSEIAALIGIIVLGAIAAFTPLRAWLQARVMAVVTR